MSPRPLPAVVRILLRILLPQSEREFFLGDMEEARRPAGDTRPRDFLWFREVLGVLSLRLNPGRGFHRNNRGKTPRKGDGMSRELLHDLRFAFRMMLRSPGFTIVALLTMALGIGANTAMFSIVNGVVLRPLPYPEADRIVLVQENNLERGWPTFSVAPLNYWDWEERNRSTELLAAYRTNSVNYTGGDRPQSVRVYRATEDFLPILGGEPAKGRGITEEDLDPDAPAVAVLTHGFWERVFGSDPDALGRTLILDDVVHTVVGILPEDWRPLTRTSLDLVLPLKPEPNWYLYRSSHFLQGLGRLAPDVSVEQARADFSSIAAALEEEYPESNEGWGATVPRVGGRRFGLWKR
jgi:putative ABC transport system permease protein